MCSTATSSSPEVGSWRSRRPLIASTGPPVEPVSPPIAVSLSCDKRSRRSWSPVPAARRPSSVSSRSTTIQAGKRSTASSRHVQADLLQPSNECPEVAMGPLPLRLERRRMPVGSQVRFGRVGHGDECGTHHDCVLDNQPTGAAEVRKSVLGIPQGRDPALRGCDQK